MNKTQNKNRQVFCADALEWLNLYQAQPDHSFIASLPDKSEFQSLTLNEWKKWFTDTAQLILHKTHPNGITIFYQSDILVEGTWVDKSYLIMKAAELENAELLFHKIICRTKPGIITFGRPAYSHLIAFSKNWRMPKERFSMPDVFPDIGEKTWERGMGLNACLGVADFLAQKTSTKTLINPFCGEGSMLAAANARNLHAIGIERSAKRAEKSQRLKLNEDETDWILVNNQECKE